MSKAIVIQENEVPRAQQIRSSEILCSLTESIYGLEKGARILQSGGPGIDPAPIVQW
jgi:hypothetical protein